MLVKKVGHRAWECEVRRQLNQLGHRGMYATRAFLRVEGNGDTRAEASERCYLRAVELGVIKEGEA